MLSSAPVDVCIVPRSVEQSNPEATRICPPRRFAPSARPGPRDPSGGLTSYHAPETPAADIFSAIALKPGATPPTADDLPGGPDWLELPELLTAPAGRWLSRWTLSRLGLSEPAEAPEPVAALACWVAVLVVVAIVVARALTGVVS